MARSYRQNAAARVVNWVFIRLTRAGPEEHTRAPRSREQWWPGASGLSGVKL
jgi:hypothetical protein